MSGPVALQAVITGLSVGAVYGLVALGFTLGYRLTRVFAFAHGDIVVGSVFIGVLAVLGTMPVARDPAAGTALALVLMTLLAGAVLSAVVYVVAVRPFLPAVGGGRTGDVAGWVVGGIASGLAIREVLGLAFSAQAYAVPDPLHLSAFTGSGTVGLPGGTSVPVRVFGVLVIGLVVAAITQLVLVRGRFGRAVRAVSADPEAAALLGVPVERVVLLAFVIAGVLAGVAGLLDAPGRELSMDAGVLLGLKGATAAVLGRLGSLRGALLGGLALGVAESLVVAWDSLGAAYGNVLPLALLVVLLVVRGDRDATTLDAVAS
jgi:branched-chain amino acid transport system permease protein